MTRLGMHNKQLRAFSLSEVILAIFLVTLISLAAYGLLIQVIRLDAMDEDRTEFIQFSQQVMESYIEEAKFQEGFDDLAEIEDADAKPLDYGAVLGEAGEESNYLYSVKVSPWDPTGTNPVTTLKRIRVRIWYTKDGATVDTEKGNAGLATQISMVLSRPARRKN